MLLRPGGSPRAELRALCRLELLAETVSARVEMSRVPQLLPPMQKAEAGESGGKPNLLQRVNGSAAGKKGYCSRFKLSGPVFCGVNCIM